MANSQPLNTVRYHSGNTPLFRAFSSLPVSMYGRTLEVPAVLRPYTTYTLWAGAPPVIRLIITLLLVYGVRVSELLRAEVRDIGACDRVYLRGAKRSLDRVILIPGISEFMTRYTVFALDQKIFGVSYAQVYGWMRRLNIVDTIEGNIKKSVTKLPRHMLADDIRREHGNATVSAALGHASKTTAEHYGNSAGPQARIAARRRGGTRKPNAAGQDSGKTTHTPKKEAGYGQD